MNLTHVFFKCAFLLLLAFPIVGFGAVQVDSTHGTAIITNLKNAPLSRTNVRPPFLSKGSSEKQGLTPSVDSLSKNTGNTASATSPHLNATGISNTRFYLAGMTCW